MSLHEIMARITRALEAFADGDQERGEMILDDLRHEIWLSIEAETKASGGAA